MNPPRLVGRGEFFEKWWPDRLLVKTNGKALEDSIQMSVQNNDLIFSGKNIPFFSKRRNIRMSATEK